MKAARQISLLTSLFAPIRVFHARATLLPVYFDVFWISFDSGYHLLRAFLGNRRALGRWALGMRPDKTSGDNPSRKRGVNLGRYYRPRFFLYRR
jgi:hypothetical protein